MFRNGLLHRRQVFVDLLALVVEVFPSLPEVVPELASRDIDRLSLCHQLIKEIVFVQLLGGSSLQPRLGLLLLLLLLQLQLLLLLLLLMLLLLLQQTAAVAAAATLAAPVAPAPAHRFALPR